MSKSERIDPAVRAEGLRRIEAKEERKVIAKDLGVPVKTVHRWVYEAKRKKKSVSAKPATQRKAKVGKAKAVATKAPAEQPTEVISLQAMMAEHGQDEQHRIIGVLYMETQRLRAEVEGRR